MPTNERVGYPLKSFLRTIKLTNTCYRFGICFLADCIDFFHYRQLHFPRIMQTILGAVTLTESKGKSLKCMYVRLTVTLYWRGEPFHFPM